MDTISTHLLIEYHGCDRDLLDDVERIEQLMRGAAKAAGATVVSVAFHRFSPQGVSGVVVVEESHMSIHTWPECGYAAVDVFTCGDCAPILAHDFLREALGAQQSEIMDVRRGMPKPGPSMQVESHVGPPR